MEGWDGAGDEDGQLDRESLEKVDLGGKRQFENAPDGPDHEYIASPYGLSSSVVPIPSRLETTPRDRNKLSPSSVTRHLNDKKCAGPQQQYWSASSFQFYLCW